jgi:uncharacterized protein (TIGR02594 family)
MNPLQPHDPEPEWLRIARTFKGIREKVDGKLNPRIAELFRVGTHFPVDKLKPDTAWCAALVSYSLLMAGVPSPHTANAAACATFGYPCKPRPGALIVLAPGVVGAGISGHVGFYEQELAKDAFWLFSGNCLNTARSQLYQTSRIVACRWPFEELAAA